MPRRKQKAQPAPPTPTPAQPVRAPWAYALGVFVVLLAVYQATMLRTVVDIDSGELVAAVHVQGIPHPTGYPLWLLLGRLFDLLPLGHSTAYRVGMMSATGVAAAGGLITLMAISLTGQVIPAVCAGLAFGLWSPPWGDSVRAMVHAIAGLFVALSILALRRWNHERSTKAMLLLSLAMGTAAMHHRMSFLAAGPAFFAVLFCVKEERPLAALAVIWLGLTGYAASKGNAAAFGVMLALLPVLAVSAFRSLPALRPYLGAAAVFVAPFFLYGYLWLRALAHPPVYWTDVTTFPRLMNHVFATQYQQFAFQHQGSMALQESAKMIPPALAGPGGLSVLLALVGLPLIIYGWWEWWKRERWVAAPLALGTVVVLLWVTHWGESSDLKHFLSPIGPALALAGALGAARLASLKLWREYAWAVPAVLGAIVCGSLFSANWAEYDFSNRWGNRDRWVAVLSQMEPNAVFVSDQDQPNFVTIYLQNVEKLRPDVTLIRAQRLSDPAYTAMIRDPEARAAALSLPFPSAIRSNAEMADLAAGFAYQLALKLKGKRPVYALHGPMRGQTPSPPAFVNVSMDLARLDFDPKLPRQSTAGAAEVDLGNGSAFAGLTLDRAKAGTGERVGFTCLWALQAQHSPVQFGLGLVPHGMTPEDFATLNNNDVRLVQNYFQVDGLWNLAATPPGQAYAQHGELIVPSNARPGRYDVALALGQIYNENYAGWVLLPGVSLDVTARPLPTNGP
jgi:hypothetical protein